MVLWSYRLYMKMLLLAGLDECPGAIPKRRRNRNRKRRKSELKLVLISVDVN